MTKPTTLLFFSALFYALNYMFGPWSYAEVAETNGVVYFLLCYSFLFFTCAALQVTVRSHRSSEVKQDFNGAGVICFRFIMIIFLGLSSYYVMYTLSHISLLGAQSIKETRAALSASHLSGDYDLLGRSLFIKFLNVVFYSSVLFFPLVSFSKNLQSDKYVRYLSVVNLLFPPVFGIVLGARAEVFFVLLVLYFVRHYQKQYGLPVFFGDALLQKIFRLIFICVPIIVVFLFLIRANIMSSGVVVTSIPVGLSGSARLLAGYEVIAEWSPNIFNALYAFSFYLSHSIPYFSWLFPKNTYAHDQLYYGLYMFRPLLYLIKPLFPSLPGYLDIVKSQYFYGQYSTFLNGLLLDYGLYVTPVVCCVVGAAYCLCYKFALRGMLFFRAMYSFVSIQIVILPIYYPFSWGVFDFMASIMVFLYCFSKLFGYIGSVLPRGRDVQGGRERAGG